MSKDGKPAEYSEENIPLNQNGFYQYHLKALKMVTIQ
jgi:hypothetical protein